jgi:uncharacterized protein YkwD
MRLGRGILVLGLVLSLGSGAGALLVTASDTERDLESLIVTAARDSLHLELSCEGPLRDAARDLSLVRAAGAEVDAQEFLRRAQSARGVLDPYPYILYGTAPRGKETQIARRLLAHLRTLPRRERRLTTHVAAGVVERSRRRGLVFRERTLFVTLLLSQRALSFAPLPERLRPGERFLFEGEVYAPFRAPEILLTRPAGDVVTLLDLSLDPGSFRTWVSLDGGAGEYQLEVVARDDMGPRVLGLASLEAGEAPTSHERIVAAARSGTLGSTPVAPPRDAPARPAAEEARMLELVNRDRVRAGLSPLALDEQLASMARAHSRDMLEHDFFAHISPNSGRLVERATAAGFRYRRLAENIAVHSDVESAEAALLRSPGHRVNILDPGFTHVGIGVAIATDDSGARRVYVTQNFALPAP